MSDSLSVTEESMLNLYVSSRLYGLLDREANVVLSQF